MILGDVQVNEALGHLDFTLEDMEHENWKVWNLLARVDEVCHGGIRFGVSKTPARSSKLYASDRIDYMKAYFWTLLEFFRFFKTEITSPLMCETVEASKVDMGSFEKKFADIMRKA